MACFSCSKDKDVTEITVLLMYKEAYEKTGKLYWFFKEDDCNELKIISDDDFAQFRKTNKKKFTDKKIQYSRIDEFRIVDDNPILGDSGT